MTGYGDDGVPTKTGLSYGDPVAGKAAAAAVALALIKRRKTGEGSNIDLGQREVMSTLIGEQFVAASLRGEEPVHRGNRDARYFAQGVYRCAGTEQWIAISMRTESEWVSVAEVLGLEPNLSDLSNEERLDEIDRRISQATTNKDPQELLEQLAARSVPAGRVLDTVAIHDDPHLAARGFWVELPHPKMATWKQPRSAWHLQEASPLPRRHAPLFGEHNDEILSGLLGLSEAELSELRERLVISDAPVNPGVG
jgi:crotonobetainyl-CoA:carnitine CoA-transferase CaiB-like acyl-CoA transferase